MGFSVGVIIMFITIIICILSHYIIAFNTPRPLQLTRSRRWTSRGSTSQSSASQESTSQEWIPQESPSQRIIPYLNEQLSCISWLAVQGFQVDNHINRVYVFNNDLIMSNDPLVSLWSSGFAYGLFRNLHYFEVNSYSPLVFCGRHTAPTALYRFMTVQNAEFTCEGWIYFYGYKYMHRRGVNYEWALNRNQILDPHISIWAATYFRFIAANEDRSQISSKQFCEGIGYNSVALPRIYPFMTLNPELRMCCTNPYEFPELIGHRQRNLPMRRMGFVNLAATFTCEEWINLYGYFADNEANFVKILGQQQVFWDTGISYDEALAHYAFLYVDYMRSANFADRMTPFQFCSSEGMNPYLRRRFDGSLLE